MLKVFRQTNPIDQVSAMIAYWDANEVCQFANRAYLDWFGKRTNAEFTPGICPTCVPRLFPELA